MKIIFWSMVITILCLMGYKTYEMTRTEILCGNILVKDSKIQGSVGHFAGGWGTVPTARTQRYFIVEIPSGVRKKVVSDVEYHTHDEGDEVCWEVFRHEL